MGSIMNLESYFDKIFCINLDSRSDRWESATEEFKKHSLQVERIPGIDGSKMNLDFPSEIKEGAVGCALSQFFAIKYAKQLGLNKFLLLEDDIEFDENINELFSQYIHEVPSNWDMLYLGGQHFHGMNLQQVSEHVYKCEYTLAAHSVAFNSTVFDRFIGKLIDITKPCDIHYAESHKEINAYVFIPHLTWQKNSYSDIEKVQVDYTFLKHHRYPQWGKP
jgi:GR25 family glycosyltransferase involved in LPS biosynthesis